MAKAPSTNSQLKGVWVIDNAIDIRYYISDRQAARALAQGGIRPNLPQNLLDELHLKQRVDEIEKRLIEFKKNNTLPTPLVDTLHS